MNDRNDRESDMQVPEEFKRFSRCFWQGSHLEVNDERDWIGRALKLSTAEQRKVIKIFIEELLASKAEVRELQQVWNSGSPRYGLDDDHVRDFFQLIHAQL
jgi:hypothetical protein